MAGFGEAESGWKPPPFYNFKPFFTLQPVQQTREKQLKLWRDLIVGYHRAHGSYRMADPLNFELFQNVELDRQLNLDGIKAVVQSLISNKLAEWEDESAENAGTGTGALLIMFKNSETLASEIYSWAVGENLVGNVATLYEMVEGNDYGGDSPFKGIDMAVVRKALMILQTSGKCVVIDGASPEEDGVKFL